MPLHLRLISLLSAIIILGSAFYYLYALTTGVILFIFVLVLVIIVLLMRRSAAIPPSGVVARAGMDPERFLLFIFFVLIAAAFYILFQHQTTEALRSPWEVVPLSFFLLYGAAITIALIAASRSGDASRATQGRDQKSFAEGEQTTKWGGLSSAPLLGIEGGAPAGGGTKLLLISAITFLTLSVSLLVFPLGAGFDPFIHQATEKIIALTGTLTPKPLYYIGQYALVVFLAKISGISVVAIDKLLVPLLAAFLLPSSIISWWNDKKKRGWHGDASEEERRGTPAGRDAMKNLQAKRPDGERVAARRSDDEEARHDRIHAKIRTPSAFLLLPFLLAPFTATTPYSLALLFLVVLIFSVERLGFSVQLLIAFATLLIHPLVGIPTLIFLIVKYLGNKKNYWLLVTGYSLLTLAIPLAFLVISTLSSQVTVQFTPQNFLPWLRSLEWHGIYRENRFNASLDLLYFYGFNIKNIFWFFVLTSILFLYRHRVRSAASPPPTIAEVSMEKSPNAGEGSPRAWLWKFWHSVLGGTSPAEHGDFPRHRSVSPDGEAAERTFVKTFIILLISYILMSGFLSFNFLIGYEQTDYAKRVLDIAQLFLLPLFLMGIHWWLKKIIWKLEIGNWKLATQITVPIMFALLITASLYFTYPQKVDSYAVSHAFNTSQADIDAVRWIENDAGREDYIVLANQAVSAAAIKEFGFKKYYQPKRTTDNVPLTTSIFFYPIPTGSPLYRFYLDLVYPPKVASQQLGGQVNPAPTGLRPGHWGTSLRVVCHSSPRLRVEHSGCGVKTRMSSIIQEAQRLVSVNRGYFVLNRYWSDFDRIFAEAQQNLHFLHSINNSVFIFTTK